MNPAADFRRMLLRLPEHADYAAWVLPPIHGDGAAWWRPSFGRGINRRRRIAMRSGIAAVGRQLASDRGPQLARRRCAAAATPSTTQCPIRIGRASTSGAGGRCDGPSAAADDIIVIVSRNPPGVTVFSASRCRFGPPARGPQPDSRTAGPIAAVISGPDDRAYLALAIAGAARE
jgi:hypothetical protein